MIVTYYTLRIFSFAQYGASKLTRINFYVEQYTVYCSIIFADRMEGIKFITFLYEVN